MDETEEPCLTEVIRRVVEILRGVERRHLQYLLRAIAIRLDESAPLSLPSHDLLGCLSKRELEVFSLLVEGQTSKSIAAALCVSPKTIETHREHILRKLNVHSVVALVRLAARAGVLQAP